MEEKKLTDEDIIRALENKSMGYGAGIVGDLYQLTLDLIQRLQAENEELKSPKFGNWKVKFFKAQEEIKRLTKENNYQTKRALVAEGRVEKLSSENAELQKQVDELEQRYLEESKERLEFEQRYKKIQHAHNIGLVSQRSQWEKKVEQAVKDTAKEIWEKAKHFYRQYPLSTEVGFCCFRDWIKEHYGVEVE